MPVWWSLVALLMPGALFAAGLFALRDDPRLPWLHADLSLASALAAVPWQLWTIAVAGGLATAAGVLDWRFHRRGGRVVGRAERRGELVALACGGLPLFALMCAASVARDPQFLLVPIVVVACVVVVMVCHDEFTFHRRCGPWETLLHRMLTLGMATAWLAWLHWCFVESRLA